MGGYQILDLKNTNFVTGTGQKIDGAYDLLEGTRKVTLLTNIVIDGTEYKDSFVELKGGVNFTGEVYGKTITITSADLVTFANPVN